MSITRGFERIIYYNKRANEALLEGNTKKAEHYIYKLCKMERKDKAPVGDYRIRTIY